MESDEFYMKMALEQGALAADAGEVPVGAIMVDASGEVIAKGHNLVEFRKDGMAHAELLVLQLAAQKIGDWRLTECTLFVTKEPCAMCAGAMVNCRLGRLVYGCGDSRAGAAGSALDITGFPGMLHCVPVTAGVLELECQAQLRDFFRRRRVENA